MQITDLLTKLSHDNDLQTVNGAILGLGLVAGGIVFFDQPIQVHIVSQ